MIKDNFKNKIGNNIYCNFMSMIKLAIKSRFYYMIITFQKKILPLLNIFLKLNYINNYKFIDNNTIIIFFIINNKRYLKWNDFKIYYKSSNYYYISINNLKKFYSKEFKKIIVISTHKGLMTHIDALKNNVSGKIIFIIF